MNVIGIVGEYNPFHFGHEYHIKMSRERLGEDSAVICAMSGDYVQRGEAAMYSKFARAEAACRGGVDLVLELPLPWVLSSAEGFARGAVALLSAAGATHLSFGSEAGETGPLEELAGLLVTPEINEEIKAVLAQDTSLSYAAARQKAVAARLGSRAALLETPNNILAVEYLKAIKTLGVPLAPMTVARRGAAHDDASGGAGYRSAMEIRRFISQGMEAGSFVPTGAAAVYARERDCGRELAGEERMELAILSRLRMLDRAAFDALPDAAGGVGARLYEAARTQPSLNAVLAAAKTKRYAMSRVRRMCMCAALGVRAEMSTGTPPYIRVLAANARGCALLRQMNDREDGLPVVTKPASVKNLSADHEALFALGASAHDLYVLGYRAEGERKGGEDWRNSPKIVNNP